MNDAETQNDRPKTNTNKRKRKVNRGKWEQWWDGGYHCSVCEKETPIYCVDLFPYCPYCGAEMEVDE